MPDAPPTARAIAPPSPGRMAPVPPGRSPIARVLPVVAAGATVIRHGRRLLDGIDLIVAAPAGGMPGLTVVMGPNGAGKSLLLRLLAGLEPPDAGTVTWAGKAPGRGNRAAGGLAMLFQRPVMLRRSALDNLCYGLWAAGLPRRERRPRALAALDRAGLAHLASMPARRLSGGEQQRLAIVRALAAEPSVLLLDEPTATLDPAATQAIEALIAGAGAAGTRILLVSHDLGQARRLADAVLFVHRGRIVEQAPADRFFDRPDSKAARDFLAGRILL